VGQSDSKMTSIHIKTERETMAHHKNPPGKTNGDAQLDEHGKNEMCHP